MCVSMRMASVFLNGSWRPGSGKIAGESFFFGGLLRLYEKRKSIDKGNSLCYNKINPMA